jgi:hypothetical protein
MEKIRGDRYANPDVIVRGQQIESNAGLAAGMTTMSTETLPGIFRRNGKSRIFRQDSCFAADYYE